MSNLAPVARSWTSPREHLVTDAEHEKIARLSRRDAEIGAAVAERYGRGAMRKRPLPARVLRRLVFELKRRFGPLLKRLARAGRRRWYRYIADRARVADGAFLRDSELQLEVVTLVGSASDLASRLEHTTATHWVLTRRPGQLLRAGLPAIKRAIRAAEGVLWFGDSRDAFGIRERRAVFSRLLLRQLDALGPVLVCSTAALREWGRAAQTTPELWPLDLALSIPASAVRLIPEVLSVGETSEQLGELSADAITLVERELRASGYTAFVESDRLGRRRVQYAVPSDTPLVSIVIPSRGSAEGGRAFLSHAVDSIVSRTSYPNFELVIVADDATPQEVVDEVDALAGERVRWVRWSSPFNFSEKMNLGSVVAGGEYLLFLNDDVELVSPDWIERMLSLIGIDGIGYTGALLFFEDATIQHAGHYYAGGPGHIGFHDTFRLSDSRQPFSLDRVVSGLTAACSCLPAPAFHEVGGFSPLFPGNYNDVDLALKLRELGSQCAVAGSARLYHFESKTRDATVSRTDIERLHTRWVDLIGSDEHWRSYLGV